MNTRENINNILLETVKKSDSVEKAAAFHLPVIVELLLDIRELLTKNQN